MMVIPEVVEIRATAEHLSRSFDDNSEFERAEECAEDTGESWLDLACGGFFYQERLLYITMGAEDYTKNNRRVKFTAVLVLFGGDGYSTKMPCSINLYS